MSSLIANQVKTNTICVLFQLNSLLFSLLLCYSSHLTDTTITMTKQLVWHNSSLSCSQPQVMFSHNSTQDWVNYSWLLPALSGPLIYARLQSAERSQSRRFSPSQELYCDCFCMYILILVWLSCLLLLVY